MDRLLILILIVACLGTVNSGCSDDDAESGGSDIFNPVDGSDSGTNDGSDTIDDSDDTDTTSQPIRLFSSEIDKVVVEVDYADGAEPYISNLTTDYWDLFRTNAEELFKISDPELEIPDELDEMENIGPVVSDGYTSSMILSLAGSFRNTQTSGSQASFYILFVDGLFREDGENKENVIGVSIGDTGVIAIFKPVIDKLGSTDNSRAMGEQATLVHEFGHAVGLVANPIPTQADHHDAEHGAHCTNEDCVMFWLNERPDELATFIDGLLLGGGTDTVLFDDQCIDDIRAVSAE